MQNCLTSTSLEANLKECKVNHARNLYDTAVNVIPSARELYMEESENDFMDSVISGTEFATKNLIEPVNPGYETWILEESKFLKPIPLLKKVSATEFITKQRILQLEVI